MNHSVVITALAVTTFERLGFGVAAALFLPPAALVVWLFPLLILGPLWRRIHRPRRASIMAFIVIAMWVASAAAVTLVPTEKIECAFGTPMLHQRRLGVTTWYVQYRWMNGWFSYSLPDHEVSAVGLLAIAPSLVAMAWVGRWLIRELPKFYRRPEPFCDECNYDMTGINSPVCPECGL